MNDDQQRTPTGVGTPPRRDEILAGRSAASSGRSTVQSSVAGNSRTTTHSKSAGSSPNASRLGFLRTHTPPPPLSLSPYATNAGAVSVRPVYPYARTPSANDVSQSDLFAMTPSSSLAATSQPISVWASSSLPSSRRPSAATATAARYDSTVVDIDLEAEDPARLPPPFRPASRASMGSSTMTTASAAQSVPRSSSSLGWRASDEDSEAQGSSHGHAPSYTNGFSAYQTPLVSISRTSSACGSIQNGYASSIDGEFHSAPPSRVISRAPTPSRLTGGGVNLNSVTQALPVQGSSLNGHAPRSPMDSDADADKDIMKSEWNEYGSAGSTSEAGRSSSRAAAISSVWGLGAAWQRSRAGGKVASASGYLLGNKRLRSSSKDKGGLPSSRVPLLNRSFSPSSGSSSSRASPRHRLRSGRRRDRGPISTLGAIITLPLKVTRAVFGPVHPLTIFVALVLISAFVTSVTTLIIYILNPDKEHVPYRHYCAMQPDFPHAAADVLDPVDVFVGVFSIDTAYERRHMIRNTYAAHSLPLDPHTGLPTANVQVKFILGRTKPSQARRVALEMEMFNDIVVLDIEENMDRGKTHAYFKWAAQNATVPIMVQRTPSSPASNDPPRHGWEQAAPAQDDHDVRWKKADFVVKADDDSLIVLDELERHLRIAPRQLTYWGYLIRDWYMGGECYALSSDLVQYVASSAEVAAHSEGKEDKAVAQWVHMHPESSRVHWVSERCWIYDHAKAGTAYSHGFLYPNEVQRIKAETKRGLSDQELARRGGERNAKAYSSVSRWKVPYHPPRSDMTIEEEVEALVEGGGRWTQWTRGESGNDTQTWLAWDQLVFEANDTRLFHPPLAPPVHTTLEALVRMQRQRAGNKQRNEDLQQRGLGWIQDALPDDEVAAAGGAGGRLLAAPLVFLSHLGIGRTARGDAHIQRADEPRLLPLPTSKEGHPPQGPQSAAALRAKRYLGRPHGGTVVIHFLKKSEWFMEAAIALLGRERLWVDGAGGAGSEWRMWGPSLVRESGYIAAGRSQPRRAG